MGRWCIVGLAALILAACSGGDDPTEPPPTQPGPGGREGIATLPAPDFWQQSSGPVTVDSFGQSAYLGRLSSSSGDDTLFAHDISLDSTLLAALNVDSLLMWDLISGELVFTASSRGGIAVYFASDHSEIYTIDNGGTVGIHEPQFGQMGETLTWSAPFSGVSDYDADADLLALGSSDGDLRVWDVFARTSLATLSTGMSEITALAFAPGAELIAAASPDGIVTVWNWETREQVAAFETDPAEYVSRLAFAPDGGTLAAAGVTTLTLWDMAAGAVAHGASNASGFASDVLLVSPDSQYVLTGGQTRDMVLWSIETGDAVYALQDFGGEEPVSAAFSPDGSLLATVELRSGIALWDVGAITSGAAGDTVVSYVPVVGTDLIRYVAWTPDGFQLLFFDALGPVYVWGLPAQE